MANSQLGAFFSPIWPFDFFFRKKCDIYDIYDKVWHLRRNMWNIWSLRSDSYESIFEMFRKNPSTRSSSMDKKEIKCHATTKARGFIHTGDTGIGIPQTQTKHKNSKCRFINCLFCRMKLMVFPEESQLARASQSPLEKSFDVF